MAALVEHTCAGTPGHGDEDGAFQGREKRYHGTGFLTAPDGRSKDSTMDELCAQNDTPAPGAAMHFVSGRALAPPWPEGLEEAAFAMGCFWGAERLFWQAPGVWVTKAGYAGGAEPDPDYKAVCTGRTGHAETVQVVFDPTVTSYKALLALFWENHDPTQGERQGNDVGTQYRSAIFVASDEQKRLARESCAQFQEQLSRRGLGRITTQIIRSSQFFPAEDCHQQYLAKNPGGYCGLKGTGAVCAI